MIDLITQEIVLGATRYPIVKWTAWWLVDGYGLYPEIKDALVTKGNIQPVPVAVADGMYEVLPPNMERKFDKG